MININPNESLDQKNTNNSISLRDFAKQKKITENKVWELIEDGELAARFVNDEIMLIRDPSPKSESLEPLVDLNGSTDPEIAIAFAAASISTEQLCTDLEEGSDFTRNQDRFNKIDKQTHSNSQDSRALLKFAQDAMNRTRQLSEQLLATKDELLRLKDEQIRQLQQRIDEQERDLRLLRRQKENLETLCKINVTL
ncbi:MAG: hypothetical protein NTX25_01200 [Proteobacteria bacterium]|nr:hypothetical protein [Pseudomonadota bacterium]